MDDRTSHVRADALVDAGQHAFAAGLDPERDFSQSVGCEHVQHVVAYPIDDIDSAGGVPLRPVAHPVGCERAHHGFDDSASTQEQVVDEAEAGHSSGSEFGHFVEDIVRMTDTDRHVRIG
jgi:hypothetical protein